MKTGIELLISMFDRDLLEPIWLGFAWNRNINWSETRVKPYYLINSKTKRTISSWYTKYVVSSTSGLQ